MQQQQHADYDLLAVFAEEAKADAAVAKLRKEGFSEEEVYQLTSGAAGKGEFRDHRANSNRSEYFLQTKRSGPNPLLVVALAIIFGLVVGGLSYLASIAFPNLTEPTTLIIGVILGLIIGAIIGIVPMTRVRGNIGQNVAKGSAAPPKERGNGARTVVALRFPDTDNPARKSRARAILLNNGGRIDRSVGRRE
jgi:hypothetical protein